MGSITFAPVDAGDADALADLRVAAMRESLERVGRFDPARARARLVDAFSPEHTRAILHAGQRVGFFVVRPAPGALVLDHLYVQPGHQGQGFGAAVLRHVFAQADAQGLDVQVGALRESESNRFYARHGFALVREEAFDNHYVRRPAKA